MSFPPRGWDFKYIPVYYALDRDGISAGAIIEGGAWGDTPLKAFFESIRD